MSFIVYPAIDFDNGKCVNLLQGKMDKSTVYSEDPERMAMDFEDKGAKWIHIVDLNGAFQGKSINADGIKAVVESVNVPIQVGGGIRSMENIDFMLITLGVSRVILGTAALKNPELVKQAILKYGDKIAVGIDAEDSYVAVNGWAESSNILAVDLAKKMKAYGVKTIIFTDILKDGMMKGPNFESAKALSDIGGLDIILAGGISTIDDIKHAKEIGLAGVISGKAIYTGAIDLKEAVKI